jgi:murein DD-endopeptidase MepM/ murein hydrolase activator NlpD
MGLLDRLTTIVITATVTSAAWIVAGGTLGGVMPRLEAEGAAAPPPAAQESGAPAVTEALMIPVEGVTAAKLRDTFSESRARGSRVHEAIDIMASRGTPVIAAAPGTVEKLFLSKAGGNTIYLRSQDRGTIHYYAHLDRYEAGLKEGQRIARGQRLGTVGSTGNASPSAPHLHFAILRTTPDAEWWEPSTAINPYPLLTGR